MHSIFYMPNDVPISLETTDDDALIYLFAFLSIPELLAIRQVSTTRTLSVLPRSKRAAELQTIACYIKPPNNLA